MSCDTEIERTGWESQAPNYFSPFLSLGDGRMRKIENKRSKRYSQVIATWDNAFSRYTNRHGSYRWLLTSKIRELSGPAISPPSAAMANIGVHGQD